MADDDLKQRLKSLRNSSLSKSYFPVKTAEATKDKSTVLDSDTDSALFARLRNLNPSSSSTASKKPVPVNSPPRDEHDEIEALINQTRDQLAVEGTNFDITESDVSDEEDQDSVQALAKEAERIVSMAKDEVSLEQQLGVIAVDGCSDGPDGTRAEGTRTTAFYQSNNDMEAALADAAQDDAALPKHEAGTTTDIRSSTEASSRSHGRRSKWSGGAFFFFVTATLVLLALSAVPGANAFGAGNIPSFAYMEGKAFRHGDIEDILEELAKKLGGAGAIFGASKFGGLDIKRIYFGNWLRDYSQAMDVAALQKMNKQAVLNIVMVLGFLAHGYATAEFQVTDERLGVYLPEEHLDNPKGYADGKDARQYDPRLREPVNPRELEVDPRSGMKNYLANESGNWRTGSGLVRNTLIRVIQMGRRARQSGQDSDLYEAYRLLGQGLHTLEDFSAHSNWTELALHRLGHHQVFLHVGDNVRVRAPDGQQVAPLVTGTFGGADFMHSLLGEAQDHLSEASISDLNKAIDGARVSSSGNNRSIVQDILGMLAKVPGGGGNNVSRDLEEVSRGPVRDPANMSPQEMYSNLWRILELRDRIMMGIEGTIEKIPGLSSLVEKLTNELNVFVFTLIEPYAKPIMQQGMGALKFGSGEVINQAAQFEVFDDPNASDPTHSMLSKDHFGLILNEVAGNVARIVVKHTVTKVVKAWDDESMDPRRVADECLAPMFHPYWFNGQAQVQKEMMDYVANWARSHSNDIRRLDKQSVRNHTNTRSGKAEPHSHGSDQPTISSFVSGGNSGYPGSSHGSHGGGGGGGSSMGSNMAGYASNYVSNQMHGFVGSHVPGGNQFFRDVPGSEPGAQSHGTQQGRHPRNEDDGDRRSQHSGESGSYYNSGDSENRHSDSRRHGKTSHGSQGHDYSAHGSQGRQDYGGNDNAPRFPNAQPMGEQYGGGGTGYGGQDYGPSGGYGGPSGGYGGPQGGYGGPQSGYGGPPGGFDGPPPGQMPYGQQPPGGYGGPNEYGYGPPGQPDYGRQYPPPGNNQWNQGGGGYGGGY